MTEILKEIAVQALAARLHTTDAFVLLDVREAWELESARINDARLATVPMSIIGTQGIQALPPAAQDQEAEILVVCHHGVRSAQVAAWLTAKGWTRAYSVSGGIDEYSRKIDPSVGSY